MFWTPCMAALPPAWRWPCMPPMALRPRCSSAWCGTGTAAPTRPCSTTPACAPAPTGCASMWRATSRPGAWHCPSRRFLTRGTWTSALPMPPRTTLCRCWSAPGAIAPTGGLDGRRAPRLSMTARVPAPPPPCAALSARSAWGILLALSCPFALSQAFRSTTAIMATGLRADFALSAQTLGVLAGAFAFAFGAMQLFIGIAIDLYGLRRTLLAVSPLTLAGALLSALAPGYGVVLFGQVLIGVGCAPAFLVCTVFIARHFEPARFAAISGVVMGISGLGLLLTGTPLAWLVQQSSWRLGFGLLAALAALAWLLVWRQVHEAAQPPPAAAASAPVRDEVRGLGALLLLPHTAGIMLLALTTYASFLSLRGLWLGPLLIERHGYSLLASGHVALFASLISLFSPACFGRLDPGPPTPTHSLVPLPPP